jgi:hypothetical protein
MIEPQAKVSVVSGTGTGKTAMFGRIALWHMLCHPVATYDGKVEIGSNTYIGAPLIQQVADGVWKEMSDTRIAIANGDFGWINQYYTIGKTKVYVHGYADQWFITQVAMKKGEAIGVAGKHRYWQLIIIDEAAGVPDEHFNVIKGTQTQGGQPHAAGVPGRAQCRLLLRDAPQPAPGRRRGVEGAALQLGEQPVRRRELAARAPGGVRRAQLHRVQDPRAGPVRRRLAPTICSRATSWRSASRRDGKAAVIADDEPYGLVVLSDVALGEYRDDSVIVLAKIIGNGDIVGEPDARRVEYIEIPLCLQREERGGPRRRPGELRGQAVERDPLLGRRRRGRIRWRS